MKYVNFIYLLLITSSFVIAMEAERKSLASFFEIDQCCTNEDVNKNISKHYLSNKQWWYVDKEIQCEKLPVHKAWDPIPDKIVELKEILDSVYFNKEGTEIIAWTCFNTCFVWNRNNGQQLERIIDNATATNPIFKTPIWKDRVPAYYPSRPKEWNPYDYELKDESEAAVLAVKNFYIAKCFKACVWDKIEKKESLQLTHDDRVNTARFNQKGIEIITASRDCTMRLWDSKTGKELLRIMYDTDVTSAYFNDMGTEIVVATDDGKIQILAKYYTNNLQQIFLKKLIDLWLQLERPDKSIDSPEKLLKIIANLLWCGSQELNSDWKELNCDWKDLHNIWLSFPKYMQISLWSLTDKKIQKYGK